MKSEQTPAKQVLLTLVGISVVIVILGLSATLLVPNVLGNPDEQANVNKGREDVAALKDVVDRYLVQIGSSELPTWEVLITPDERGVVWLEGYSQAPMDPYGNEYELRPRDRGDYEILFWGPDGLPDTEDDISSRTIKDE